MTRLRNMTIRVALSALAVLTAFAVPVSARKWTDNTGRHHWKGDLVECRDGKVKLRGSDGATISLPVARLSEKDRKWIDKMGKDVITRSKPTDQSGSAQDGVEKGGGPRIGGFEIAERALPAGAEVRVG